MTSLIKNYGENPLERDILYRPRYPKTAREFKLASAVREIAKETPGAIYVFIGSQGNISNAITSAFIGALDWEEPRASWRGSLEFDLRILGEQTNPDQ